MKTLAETGILHCTKNEIFHLLKKSLMDNFIFCAISDHHKLIGTMLRYVFAKGKFNNMFYRCYKNFENGKFEEEIKNPLVPMSGFESFHLAFKFNLNQFQYVKSVQIRSYFWSVFSCIRTRNNSVFGHFSRSDLLF